MMLNKYLARYGDRSDNTQGKYIPHSQLAEFVDLGLGIVIEFQIHYLAIYVNNLKHVEMKAPESEKMPDAAA
jgi:hypothetical protein